MRDKLHRVMEETKELSHDTRSVLKNLSAIASGGYQGAASRSHRARFWLAAIRAAIPVLLDSAPECMHTHATPLLRVAQGAG